MKSPTVQSKAEEVLDLGLVASGNCNSWTVDIDQTASGVERWFAQIKGPSARLYIEIPSLQVIEMAAKSFALRLSTRAESTTAETLEMGEFAKVPVLLVFDDEFHDRCFFLIADKSQSTIRIAVTGEDFTNLATAMLRSKDELDRIGWLTSA